MIIESKLGNLSDLCRKHRVRRLALFGSAASSEFDETQSDIDFLVSFDKMSPSEHSDHYFDFIEDLEDLFGVPVDLLEEEPIDNPYLRKAIEESKVILYNAA